MKFNFFKFFIFILFSTNLTFCDAAVPWQIGFQDPATPIMEGIINFHNHIMFFLVITGLFVCWLLFRCCVRGVTVKDNSVQKRLVLCLQQYRFKRNKPTRRISGPAGKGNFRAAGRYGGGTARRGGA